MIELGRTTVFDLERAYGMLISKSVSSAQRMLWKGMARVVFESELYQSSFLPRKLYFLQTNKPDQ